MSHSEMFANVVESLLAGEIICKYTNEERFEYLSRESNFEEVSDHLLRIRRRLRKTRDESGILLAHADSGSKRSKIESKRVFEEMGAYLRPMVFWMAWAQRCDPMGNPIKAGDTLKKSELLAALEESTDIARELEDLCRLKPFQNENSTPDGRLNKILSKLVEMGYLVEQGQSRSIYRATARVSLYHDLMSFITEHEGITEEDDEQENLSLELDHE